MFFTARQLEQLFREGGLTETVLLPYRARLTPSAQDWVRLKKIAVGYSDEPFRGTPSPAVAAAADIPASGTFGGEAASSPIAGGPTGALLWWCDGPCGTGKAAIAAQSRESLLRGVELPADGKQIVPMLKTIAREIKAGSATSAALLVQNAAAAVVFANRCPSLRAIVGTSLDAVEQGIRQTAANVLVIEHPQKTLQQIKNMLSRFARAKRELSPEVQRQLAELARCD